MPSRCTRQSSAFTLVELLVVVAITALLISMLLPGLRQARELAQSVACSANLRQTTGLMMSYLNDFNNAIPMVFDATGGRSLTDSDPKSRPWYRMYEQHYLRLTGNARAKIFDCPASAVHYPEDRNIEGLGPICNYGFNWKYLGDSWSLRWNAERNLPYKHKRIYAQQVGRPGEQIVYGDSNYTSWRHYLLGWRIEMVDDVRPTPRHPSLTANVSYFDGHCESVSYDIVTDPAIFDDGQVQWWNTIRR